MDSEVGLWVSAFAEGVGAATADGAVIDDGAATLDEGGVGGCSTTEGARFFEDEVAELAAASAAAVLDGRG